MQLVATGGLEGAQVVFKTREIGVAYGRGPKDWFQWFLPLFSNALEGAGRLIG